MESTPAKPNPTPDVNERCTAVLEDVLEGYTGIQKTELDLHHGKLRIDYDPRVISHERALRMVQHAGTQALDRVNHCDLKSESACALCLDQFRESFTQYMHKISDNSHQPVVSYQNGVMEIELPGNGLGRSETARVEGVFAAPAEETAIKEKGISKERVEIAFTAVTAIAGVLIFLGQQTGYLSGLVLTFLYVTAYITGGYFGLIKATKELLIERRLNVDLLMITAALGAALIGQPAEGVALLFLFSLSNTLQSYAMDRSRKAIEKLLDLRPPTATVRRGSRVVTLPVELLVIGDVVMVRPGERFPIDGQVIAGNSTADQSSITGESLPVPKAQHDQVFAGTVNGNGSLEIRTTRLAKDTTLAKIVTMVEEAQSSKARTQHMLDNFEQYYALFVLGSATLLILIPFYLLGHEFYPTFYRSMTLLVVASPCALVISTPASILSAIANAARNGILFKGGVHLERTAMIKVVAFDKTGTLTSGEPTLTGLVTTDAISESELLRLVASVEHRSEHPLGAAIVQAAEGKGISLAAATEFQSFTGLGVEATVEDKRIWIGNERMFIERRVEIPAELRDTARQLEHDGQTVMFAYARPQWLGLLAVADTLRPDAAQIVANLKKAGIERVVMLTGDNERVAASIAANTGVDEYHAGLLPQDKVEIINELKAQYGEIAMVGDGINDAPALATANLGVAMGGAGTDVALETADIVLMADDLAKLPYAIGLSHRARGVVYQNIVFSMAVIIVLVGAAFGANLPLPLGVIGHEGSTVIVVLNGLRLLAYKG
jgi:Zn2+/Cd2+-exporting ATPase